MKDHNDKEVTIADLAVMVKAGFDAVDEKFELVDKRFTDVIERLDRIEHILIAGHDRRIERLEDNMRRALTALKIA